MSGANISALRSAAAPASVPIAVPSRRIGTRIVLPAAIVLSASALLAYSGRESLRPALPVEVVPAVAATVSGATNGAERSEEIVQAPGWIEAEPYSTWVAALATGVVREIRALDGEPVTAGQIVARLVDEDARLGLRRAEAQIQVDQAAVAQAEAKVLATQARIEEARDAWRRFESIEGRGVVAGRELVERRQRLAETEAELAGAQAAVQAAQAEVSLSSVMRDEAALALERTEVRAPIDGVVLQRVVEPGQRVMLDANNPYAGTVLRLYDPKRLQARVDIPLADSAKVAAGDEAEISIEMLPGRVFKGRLTRFVHEANSQKNTVQVKIALVEPAAELKPESLVKCRILGHGQAGRTSAAPQSQGAQRSAVLIPRLAAVSGAGGQAAVWVVDLRGPVARRRTVTLGMEHGGAVEVVDGLQVGDRVIVSPPTEMHEGQRLDPRERQQEDATWH